MDRGSDPQLQVAVNLPGVLRFMSQSVTADSRHLSVLKLRLRGAIIQLQKDLL